MSWSHSKSKWEKGKKCRNINNEMGWIHTAAFTFIRVLFWKTLVVVVVVVLARTLKLMNLTCVHVCVCVRVCVCERDRKEEWQHKAKWEREKKEREVIHSRLEKKWVRVWESKKRGRYWGRGRKRERESVWERERVDLCVFCYHDYFILSLLLYVVGQCAHSNTPSSLSISVTHAHVHAQTHTCTHVCVHSF